MSEVSPALHVIRDSSASHDGGLMLDVLIRRDQLQAVRQSVGQAILANMVLGFAGTLVAVHAGHARAGTAWYAASTVANLLRLVLCRAPCPGLTLSSSTSPDLIAAAARSINQHLRLACLGALLSGFIWAASASLCANYTSAQSPFYIAVICGITAGAVTYGIAFARIPTCFITPPILCLTGCLAYAGGFDRDCLAAAVFIYLIGLIRGATEAEKGFRITSRLKYEATALASSREEAHASASALAEEMRWRATHDDLSGLLNRAGFTQKADERLKGADRAVCLLLLDLDGFKLVNDVYGHSAGDRVLVEVARRIGAALPADCLVSRLGGDEFAMLYEPAQAAVSPEELATRLIRLVAEPFETFDAGRLGISIGIYRAAGVSLTDMLSCADEALYAAKGAGRNRFRSFDAGLRDGLQVRRDSERDLSQALADEAVELWFQPICRGDGRIVVGLEALVRWHHPIHGWIVPSTIIAAAAAAGRTEDLLRYILARVCSMIRTLQDQRLADIEVSMNISPREMAQIPVDEIILEQLRALDLSPTMLVIEITEDTALDIGAVQAKLSALTQAGIRVALDDFGSGYSSLASLRQLRADRIKMDRSLVTGLKTSDDKMGLVHAVLGLGRALGLEVVAEGVETADDLSMLQAMGCRLVQGYHLGRPAPPQETMRMMLESCADAA